MYDLGKFAEQQQEIDNNHLLFDEVNHCKYNLFKTPINYYERQKYSKIDLEKPFDDLSLFENKLIGFSGPPASSKTTICLNIIQSIINKNPHYQAILFSLELNRATTVSKLAKVPIYLDNADQETADKYYKQDQEYIKKHIQSGKIGIIDRTTDIKNDITVIKEILENFKLEHYDGKETEELNSWQGLQEYRERREKEPKLLIFIDYFDIMRVDEKLTGDTDYKKEAYLIDQLKTFRDKYNFVTFIIINSTNKTGLNGIQSQASIKGNSAIIFGYDQSFSLENIKGKAPGNHPHLKTINKENLSSNEGIIIIEDTKNRFSGKCTHLYKAIKGYSAFIKLDSSAGNGSTQETDKQAGKKTNYIKDGWSKPKKEGK
jgi:hypothetical protein